MTLANPSKNLLLICEQWVDEKLNLYERTHNCKLEGEERAMIKLLLQSLFFSQRIKAQERKFQLTQSINLN